MSLFKKKRKKGGDAIAKDGMPRHVAIIMDGNGRWARKRALPRKAGHAAGSETFRTIAYYCRDIGLEYLTVYAFSTENWKRPDDEVDAIMGLLGKYLDEAIVTMERDGIRMRVFGDISRLPDNLRAKIEETNNISKHINGFQANICINYGGRAEIVRASRIIAEKVLKGQIMPEDIDENCFSQQLYSAGIPDPELIIRPSGEYRLSNFLLWQCAYSELYFTDKLWPDFKCSDIDKAIEVYRMRDRRFGGI